MIKNFKINLFIFSIILSLILSFLTISILNKKVSPILFNYAELEIQKISTAIINRAINKQLAVGIDTEKLYNVVVNDNGEVQTIDFNSLIVNKVLNTTTSMVLINLKKVENGDIDYLEISDIVEDRDNLKKGIIYELPTGAISNNIFISNLGAKIPIKLKVIGSVESNIVTNIKEYGINNVLIEVYVRIKVTEQINIPFISKNISVISDIPIAIKIIQGKVPQYYGGNLSKKSNILSIPIE